MTVSIKAVISFKLSSVQATGLLDMEGGDRLREYDQLKVMKGMRRIT